MCHIYTVVVWCVEWSNIHFCFQVGNLGLLFMLLFFIYAALGVELFGKLGQSHYFSKTHHCLQATAFESTHHNRSHDLEWISPAWTVFVESSLSTPICLPRALSLSLCHAHIRGLFGTREDHICMITFFTYCLLDRRGSIQLIFSGSVTMCQGRGLTEMHLRGQNKNFVMKKLPSVKCYYNFALRTLGKWGDVCLLRSVLWLRSELWRKAFCIFFLCVPHFKSWFNAHKAE